MVDDAVGIDEAPDGPSVILERLSWIVVDAASVFFDIAALVPPVLLVMAVVLVARSLVLLAAVASS